MSISSPPPGILYGPSPKRYCPPSEDVPMTFQVGLVGSDGVLLASDKRVRDVRGGLVATFDTDKIVVLDDLHLAYCFAGDLLARHAAGLIVTELRKHTHPLAQPGPLLQEVLHNCAENAWHSEFRLNS